MPKVNACYQADEGDAEDVGLESFILKSEKAEALDKEYDETYFILADMEKDAEFETRRIGRYPVEFTTIEREMTQEEVIETLQTVSSLEEFKEIYEQNMNENIQGIITADLTLDDLDFDEEGDDGSIVKMDQTLDILDSLGFEWPVIDEDYLKRFIKFLNEVNYFD